MSPPLVIIGGGHNGLTAAFYLAKAGVQTLVLERREIVGGAAVTEDLAPGYRCPTLAHAVGPLREAVVRDMRLAARGVEFIRPDPRLVALSPDGRALVFSPDVSRTVQAIRPFSDADAARYPEFCGALERLGAFLSELLEATPPSLDGPAAGELWDLLKTGRRFRALGRSDGFRLLRWLPMAAADLVGEWFATDLLQAAIAARGIFGVSQGPWSAGTGAVLLLNAAVDPVPGGSSVMIKGGPGALTLAMADAARQAGADIRTNAAVQRIVVRDGRATGVVLDDGSEIAAHAVVSNADPRRTLLGLVDPIELDPGFLTRVRNYRARGTAAKINLALSALPSFTGVANPSDLKGRIHIGPGIDYLERAFDASKYGEISAAPYLDVTFPSLHDPSMAPAGAHVMSIYVQFAPFALANGRPWSEGRRELAAAVMRTLSSYAPDLESLIVHQQVLTPADLESGYGLTGGHILHGEPSLDQLFTMRPLLGWAQYRTPIRNLYLCGSGTHPGGGVTAGSGANAAREILRDLKSRK
ncbi:MAG TPA: NAD(P)/FAD-dependent oxidoreductase [Vicinamibacterales bacterium]|nr:NAD(P)/FAD-dependent oxidoreductase [Vicinamibacterales bacterium]